MTTYSHNSLNQVTAIGGTVGPMPVIVRGATNEPAAVEVKSGATGSAWKDARMLAGNRFESDLDLAAGTNAIDVRATDGSSNVANYTYSLTLAAASSAAPAYDADGNMTSDGTRGYEWDSMSRLLKVTWGGSPVKSTEYRYNALGQRSERIEKSGNTETAHSIISMVASACFAVTKAAPPPPTSTANISPKASSGKFIPSGRATTTTTTTSAASAR